MGLAESTVVAVDGSFFKGEAPRFSADFAHHLLHIWKAR